MLQTHTTLMQRVRALVSDRSGHSAIEFAFLAPAMMMFILGIGEVGRVMWLQNALDYSVTEAARCVSNSPNTCSSPSATESFAASESGAGFDSSVFTATTASCGNKVSASYDVVLNIPYVDWSTTLTAQACYPT